jgi:hypothetical protein
MHLRNRISLCRAIVILCLVDGSIHALEAQSGRLRWSMSSGGPVIKAYTFSDEENTGQEGQKNMETSDSHLPAKKHAGENDKNAEGGSFSTFSDVQRNAQDGPGAPTSHEYAKREAEGPAGDADASSTNSVAEIPRGDGAWTEENNGIPEVIPSYERGGGLWIFMDGRLKKVEMTAR